MRSTSTRCLFSRCVAVTLLMSSSMVARSENGLSYGSGHFGEWTYDRWGLPAYVYTLDERSDPRAEILEAGGDRSAWHQVGNDRFMANAYNHGYVQVWTQDRDYQWLNKVEESSHQYGGGFGYLRVGDRLLSTLSSDRGDRRVQRRFGVGYFRRVGTYGDIAVEETVYAPYGDASYLYHDVTLENRTAEIVGAVWWEYWGVNPMARLSLFEVEGPGSGADVQGDPFAGMPRPLGEMRYEPASKLLSVEQLPIDGDDRPLSIFAAAVDAPVSGFETSTDRFFGSGTRARPEAVVQDRATSQPLDSRETVGPSQALFAFRSPVSLGPRQMVTLRYVYGYGHREELAALTEQAASVEVPLEVSQRQWRAWLPRAEFDGEHSWLARELAWAAYLVRSASMYEEPAGYHIITQGEWYQYGLGLQLAFRDPLQHMLPAIYADPDLARDVILYSAQQQHSVNGVTPFAIARLGGTVPTRSSDNDVWLMLAVTEYVFASRDFAFLDTRVAWRDGGKASLWEHLKLAYRHQESFADGDHGLYRGAEWGDWSDTIVEKTGLTETTLVAAQLAFIYPRLAEIARRLGDERFAEMLHKRGRTLKMLVDREWVVRGWLSRGYAGDRQLGSGVIYGEPQPWGLLSGALDAERSVELVHNIRRYLTGIGAPAELGGPSRIGTSQSPALEDPQMGEPGVPPFETLSEKDAVWLGGAWFAVNGWLTWALGSLEGILPEAREYAWDELKRNTMAAHANAFPDHWNGIISIDDFCYSWYSKRQPQRCGHAAFLKRTGQYGQNTHQPAWLLFNAIKLAGFQPTVEGYTIDPRLPLDEFSLRLSTVGIDVTADYVRAYFRLRSDDRFRVRFRKPATWSGRAVTVRVNGARSSHEETEDGYIGFFIPPATDGATRRWSATTQDINTVEPLQPLP